MGLIGDAVEKNNLHTKSEVNIWFLAFLRAQDNPKDKK